MSLSKSESSSGKRRLLTNFLWDAWCCLSIAGIWPRWIEPQLLSTTHLTVPMPGISTNLKILQISDIHINRNVPQQFLDRLAARAAALQPDILALTGDFINQSYLDAPKKLLAFLRKLHAPAGVFAIFGNHDYAEYVSIGPNGDYDIRQRQQGNIIAGLQRLFSRPHVSGKISSAASAVPHHEMLCDILEKANITLLSNKTLQVPVGNDTINITGLGDYMAGRCDPDTAFSEYDPNLAGVVLSHNPDTIPKLERYPGNLILCGHTHGGAVNLPFLRNRLVVLENMELIRGLHRRSGKTAYVSRGIGGTIPFRWFCPPELVLITLQQETS